MKWLELDKIIKGELIKCGILDYNVTGVRIEPGSCHFKIIIQRNDKSILITGDRKNPPSACTVGIPVALPSR